MLEMLMIYLSMNLQNVQIAYWIINLYIYALIRSSFYAFDVLAFIIVISNFLSVRSYFKEHKGINIVDYFYLLFRKLVKMLPVYLIVFFALWAFVPFISDAPAWYTNEKAFS